MCIRATAEKSFAKHLFLVYMKYFLNAQVALIKPFAMNLYSLIGYIPKSTNRFTQKCDCFQSYSHK